MDKKVKFSVLGGSSLIAAIVARPTSELVDGGSSTARGNFLSLSLTLEISELKNRK